MTGHNTAAGGPAPVGGPAAAAHRALAERWFGRAWAGGDTGIAEEVFAERFVLNGREVGPDGPRRSVAAVHSAFSRIGVTLDLVLSDGPYTVIHYTTTARHTGDFRGVPPSGRPVTATGIVIWEVRDGKVVRDWNVFDTAGLLAQIAGAAPSPPDSPAGTGAARPGPDRAGWSPVRSLSARGPAGEPAG